MHNMRTLMESIESTLEASDSKSTVLVDGNVTLDNIQRTENSEVFTATANGFGSSEGSEDYDIDVSAMQVEVTIEAFGDIYEGEFNIVSVTSDSMNFVAQEGYTLSDEIGISTDDIISAMQTESVDEAMGPMAKINDAGEIEMTKSDYAKIHSDYRSKIDDTYMALHLHPKTGATVLLPVKFIDGMKESRGFNGRIGGANNYRLTKSSPDKDYVYQITRNGEKLEDDKYQSLEDAKKVITNMKRVGNPISSDKFKILKMKRPKLAGPTGKLPESATTQVCKDCGDEMHKPTTDCSHDCNDEMGDHWTTDTVKEAAKPDFADIDNDGDECEDMKKAAKEIKESPTMDTTQLVSLLHNAGLSEEAIEKKLNEWANSPVDASETEPTSHGDPYDFAQPVNLSLKRYMDAEDKKVSVTEHTVDSMKSLYEASKNKPDFADIDKDGDTDEDMKDAAKDVKEAVSSTKVCKDCGDEMHKPTTDCSHDCDDESGSHWVDEAYESLEEAQSPAQKAAFKKMLDKKEPTMDDEPEYDGDKKEPSVEESLEESKELAILLRNAGL